MGICWWFSMKCNGCHKIISAEEYWMAGGHTWCRECYMQWKDMDEGIL